MDLHVLIMKTQDNLLWIIDISIMQISFHVT